MNERLSNNVDVAIFGESPCILATPPSPFLNIGINYVIVSCPLDMLQIGLKSIISSLFLKKYGQKKENGD